MQYAIETIDLVKQFKGCLAVNKLNLKVPIGSIYGFIGENGSGKSTTEKLICGLLVPSSGQIKLFDKPYTDAAVRANMGVMIESPACFPNSTVYQNLMMQAYNLGIKNPDEEIKRVLTLVNMLGSAGRKFKHCSLGMKQRIGIAQSLMGNPKLLILDEPINGLDADGMRIVRDTLISLNKDHGITILVSSHILGELEKVATHYGIIRNGTLIKELSAAEMSKEWKEFVLVKPNNIDLAIKLLKEKYKDIVQVDDAIRVHDETLSENVVDLLVKGGVKVKEIRFQRIGLEEYYLNIMENKVIA